MDGKDFAKIMAERGMGPNPFAAVFKPTAAQAQTTVRTVVKPLFDIADAEDAEFEVIEDSTLENKV